MLTAWQADGDRSNGRAGAGRVAARGIAPVCRRSIADRANDRDGVAQASRREGRARDARGERQDAVHSDRRSVQGHPHRRRRDL